MPLCHLYGSGVKEVALKFIEYAPEDYIEWIDPKNWIEADLIIEHTIGSPDREVLVHPSEHSFSEDVKARLEMAEMGLIKIAYVHHCEILDNEFYNKTFDTAVCCIGFLDADSILDTKDKWIRMSWCVEPSEFLLPMNKNYEFEIYTFGFSADPNEEFFLDIYNACKKTGKRMLHSGYDYKFDERMHYFYLPPANNKQEIANRYNRCKYSNAMRNADGFEFSNIESPLANSRPIALNFGSYVYFFKDFSSILLDPSKGIEDQLIKIFQSEYKPITIDEKINIIEKFSWRNSTKPFWDKIMEEFEDVY